MCKHKVNYNSTNIMTRNDIDIRTLLSIYKAKGYVINDNTPFHLNIGSIRNESRDGTKYDDWMFVFRKCPRPKYAFISSTNHLRKYEDGWSIDIFAVTTNPGTPLLLKPINPKGTAIVCPGQYLKVWKKGYHQGKKDHPALRQVNPIKVYRDNNKNTTLDYDTNTEIGLFGINCHRASKWNLKDYIGQNSAGCQVHLDYTKYTEIFLYLINASNEEGYEYFDYTLIDQIDYEKAR